MKYITNVDGVEYQIELLEDGGFLLNGEDVQVDLQAVDARSVYTVLVDGRSFEAALTDDNGYIEVIIEGVRYRTEVVDEHAMLLRQAAGETAGASGEFELEAPMPGLVVGVPVEVGQVVETGTVLVILESMKMQNELRTPHAGVVQAVNVQTGDNVEKREVLVVITSGEEE